MTAGEAAGRTASILRLYRPVADEIVVAVDERRESAVPVLAAVADRVLTFPFEEPGDRPIPWLFASCRQPWILNVDDDEVPSRRLLAVLPAVLVDDVTHCWIGRRWLHPDERTYLAEPPWAREYQLRLVRADSRFLQFSDEFHRPVVCHGPARYVEEPLWHLDTAVNGFERRRRKAMAYERARRGMRIASFAHNAGLYLPELRPKAATLPVPREDLAVIRRVLEAPDVVAARAAPHLAVEHADRADLDRHWPGPPWPDSFYEARLELAERPPFLVAGVQQTIDVRVENRSDRTWRWNSEGRPAIRLSYRWTAAPDGDPLQTPLPCDAYPGESIVVPVHVLPPSAPGRHTLELDLVHEHVRWFGRTVRLPIEVRRRRRVAVAAQGEALERALDALFEPPDLEPVILRSGEPVDVPTGHPELPGLRSYLVGVDRPIPRVKALWRAGRVVATPRRFFPGLEGCELLVVAGRDWDEHAPVSRELLRVAATLAAARRLGVAVVVEDDLAPEARGPVDRLLLTAIRRLGKDEAAAAEAAAAQS